MILLLKSYQSSQGSRTTTLSLQSLFSFSVCKFDVFVLQGREICVGSLYCRALGIELDSSIECVVVCRSVRKCDSTNTQPIIVVASYLAGARIHFFSSCHRSSSLEDPCVKHR